MPSPKQYLFRTCVLFFLFEKKLNLIKFRVQVVGLVLYSNLFLLSDRTDTHLSFEGVSVVSGNFFEKKFTSFALTPVI